MGCGRDGRTERVGGIVDSVRGMFGNGEGWAELVWLGTGRGWSVVV